MNDKNNDVQESISASLVDLGKKRPEFILNIAKNFVNKNLSKAGIEIFYFKIVIQA